MFKLMYAFQLIPATGDTTPVKTCIILAAAAAVVAIVTLIMSKKKK